MFARFALALCMFAAYAAAKETAHHSGSPLVTSTKEGNQTHWTVQWKNNKGYPDSIEAQCGDTVTFQWGPDFTHNVGVAVDGDCDSVFSLTKPAKSGDHTYALNDTVSSEQPFDILADSGVWGQHANKWRSGKVWFACDVGSHCSKGKMIIGFVIKGDCANFTSNFNSNFTSGSFSSYHSSSFVSNYTSNYTSSSIDDLDISSTKNGTILTRHGKVVPNSELPPGITVVNGATCFGCGTPEEAAKTVKKSKDALEQSKETLSGSKSTMSDAKAQMAKAKEEMDAAKKEMDAAFGDDAN